MTDSPPSSKVYYRPIEAAIRWPGLLKFEKEIVSRIPTPINLPPRIDCCPRWSELRLYTERIYDAIFNKELPYGSNGITQYDESLWGSPDLTIRHVDLKKWMRDHYPEHRPGFLFSRAESISHPVITLETGQALLIERQALKTELDYYKCQFHELQEQHQGLLKQCEQIPACKECLITDRAEATYQNIIGALLALLLSQSPGGVPYSSFRTQEAIVSALVAHYGGIMGITERTLNGKFALARRRMREAATETIPTQ